MKLFSKASASKSVRGAGKDPLRYRAYYWTMNAAFVYQAGFTLVIDVLVINVFGIGADQVPAVVVQTVSLTTLFFETVVMPLLLAVPFWRDEYAETLWKRTVYQIVTLAALIVPIMLFSNIMFFTLVGPDNFPVAFANWYRETLFVELNFFRAVMGVFGYFTLVFVLLFQFNRWRDSRAASE